jgi:hypothetical protein
VIIANRAFRQAFTHCPKRDYRADARISWSVGAAYRSSRIVAGNWHGNQTRFGIPEAAEWSPTGCRIPNLLMSCSVRKGNGWLPEGATITGSGSSIPGKKLPGSIARKDSPGCRGVMAFSPDDSLVAAAMTQSMIRIFQVDTGTPPVDPRASDATSIQRHSIHSGPETPDRVTHRNRILIWEILVLDQLRVIRMEL